jgi:UDP-N-acetylmuramate dehydrogenase
MITKQNGKPFRSLEGLYGKINKIVDASRMHLNTPMKEHTSFKIGGPAGLLIEIASVDEAVDVIKELKSADANYFIMGNGSNLLVSDDGYTGVVVKLSEYLTNVTINGNEVTAESGILLSTLSKIIAKESLIGFEFASGIPGTVGGAITMNAGAYDGEMKDCVKSVKVLTQEGKVLEFTNENMNFGYRMSDVKVHDYIVLESTFIFEKGEASAISEKTKDFTERRTSKQPLTLPSAGSMFKRPVGYYAGKLIDDSGLRGVRNGDAQISEKHCGFVVNRGNATCKEVLDLIQMVRKVVMDNYGVMLETEVKYLGG